MEDERVVVIQDPYINYLVQQHKPILKISLTQEKANLLLFLSPPAELESASGVWNARGRPRPPGASPRDNHNGLCHVHSNSAVLRAHLQ